MNTLLSLNQNAPIGVFDSGIGGLSVLSALRHHLPAEDFVYYADSAHAPYGEKGDMFVSKRSHNITELLRQEHNIKALVVACNTATAAAITTLRSTYPTLPIIGIEPALKPAVANSHSGQIAVLATRGTLTSHKFQALLQAVQTDSPKTKIICQPCDGLAEAIETHSHDLNHPNIHQWVKHYLYEAGILNINTANNNLNTPTVDTLLLGCTHYPLILPVWQTYLPNGINIVNNGAAVARQLGVQLAKQGLLLSTNKKQPNKLGTVLCLSSLAGAAKYTHLV